MSPPPRVLPWMPVVLNPDFTYIWVDDDEVPLTEPPAVSLPPAGEAVALGTDEVSPFCGQGAASSAAPITVHAGAVDATAPADIHTAASDPLDVAPAATYESWLLLGFDQTVACALVQVGASPSALVSDPPLTSRAVLVSTQRWIGEFTAMVTQTVASSGTSLTGDFTRWPSTSSAAP